MATPETDARRALLGRLIDHAPLFPPASLALPEALAEDRRARESDTAWMLARFVCPVGTLVELGAEDRALSVVVATPEEIPFDPRVEALETRSDEPVLFAGLDAEVYVELAPDLKLEANLDTVGILGLRAKVRCGGERVPTAEELARFVRGCRERDLVFKATAGLHHAVRAGDDHGLLNLLAACVFGDEELALAEDDPAAFALDAESFRWRDRSATAPELAATRASLFHSIGSCSFFEPVEELQWLEIL